MASKSFKRSFDLRMNTESRFKRSHRSLTRWIQLPATRNHLKLINYSSKATFWLLYLRKVSLMGIFKVILCWRLFLGIWRDCSIFFFGARHYSTLRAIVLICRDLRRHCRHFVMSWRFIKRIDKHYIWNFTMAPSEFIVKQHILLNFTEIQL